MTPTQKDLIDTDGENRAVRAFLLGREVGCKDYEQMRRHMTNSGFNNCWPSEFAGLGGHMSKGDQQMWLRHLFALERLGALAEQPAPMSQPNRLVAYSAASKLRELGYEWADDAWKQPAEQEPVAYVCTSSHVTADGSMEDGPDYLEWADEASDYEKRVGTPLYTAPQPAKRVPLTDDDIDVLWAKQQTKPFKTHAEDRMAFASAVIAAYDAKNGITGEQASLLHTSHSQ